MDSATVGSPQDAALGPCNEARSHLHYHSILVKIATIGLCTPPPISLSLGIARIWEGRGICGGKEQGKVRLTYNALTLHTHSFSKDRWVTQRIQVLQVDESGGESGRSSVREDVGELSLQRGGSLRA